MMVTTTTSVSSAAAAANSTKIILETEFKSSFISQLVYYTVNFWYEEGDSRIFHYPFMSSGPWTTIAAICCYLYFVKLAGPSMMKNRQAFNMKELMVCYNFLMVTFSAWMFIEGCLVLNLGINSWSCKSSREMDIKSTKSLSDEIINKRFLFVTWAFFFSKLIEFSDTIFMVLRKKNNQISNLHVIHHSVVPLSVWIGIKFAPVAVNAWFPLLNSFVHTLMYGYFGLMALNNSLSENVQKKLHQFKPWMTRIQIIQFLLAIVHWAVLTLEATNDKSCTLPTTYFYLNLGNALLFLALFTNFYRQSYTKKVVDELTTQFKSQVNNAVNAYNQAADVMKQTTNTVSANSIVAAISSHGTKLDKIE